MISLWREEINPDFEKNPALAMAFDYSGKQSDTKHIDKDMEQKQIQMN